MTKVEKEERTKTWLETSSSESSLFSEISNEAPNEIQKKLENEHYKLEVLNENDHSDYEGNFTKISFKPIYNQFIGKGFKENNHPVNQEYSLKSNPNNISTDNVTRTNKLPSKVVTAFSTRNLFKMPDKFYTKELDTKSDESNLKFNDKILEFGIGNQIVENDYTEGNENNYIASEFLQNEECPDRVNKSYVETSNNLLSALNSSTKFKLSNAMKLIPSKNSPFISYQKTLNDNQLKCRDDALNFGINEKELNDFKMMNNNFENSFAFNGIEEYGQLCSLLGIDKEMILNEAQHQDINQEDYEKYYLEANNEQEYEKIHRFMFENFLNEINNHQQNQRYDQI